MNQIKEYGKLGVIFYAIKITETTNKMFAVLSESYQEITGLPIFIENLKQASENFGFFVGCTVLSTVNKVGIDKNVEAIKHAIHDENIKIEEKKENIEIEKIEKEKEKEKEIIEGKRIVLDMMFDEPFWANLQKSKEFVATLHEFNLQKPPNNNILLLNWKNPVIVHTQQKVNILLCNRPFSKGPARYAFYLTIKENPKKGFVAKLPFILNEATYTLDSVKIGSERLFYTTFFLNEFNKIMKPIVGEPLLIKGMNGYVLEILFNETKNVQYKLKFPFYYVEDYIEGKYSKFGKQTGLFTEEVKKSILLVDTFSHFTWHYTNGFLLITDPECVTGFFVDPYIHCLDKTKFGRRNKGYEGIVNYFAKHKCNEFCKLLNLVNPEILNDIENAQKAQFILK